jgi:lipoyl synthase
MTFVPLQQIGKPEGTSRPSQERQRLPPWFKVRLSQGPDYREIRQTMDRLGLHTICEEARCPNVWECWNNRTATFLILGDICTRPAGRWSWTGRNRYESRKRSKPWDCAMPSLPP